jgi:hypothetical protein
VRCITDDRRQASFGDIAKPTVAIPTVISLVGLRAELSHGKPTGFDTEIQKNDQE